VGHWKVRDPKDHEWALSKVREEIFVMQKFIK
jgi:hypothetical protein